MKRTSLLPPWRRALRWLLLPLLASLALVGCSTFDEHQRRWIFQPSDRTWAGGLAAADGMQDVWIEFDSRLSGKPVKLHALWLPQPRADAPVLLYLHGARWNVRGSAFRMRRMHELGFAVLGVDYRGFGQSSAELPSEEMAAEDALAAWQWLQRRAAPASDAAAVSATAGAVAAPAAVGAAVAPAAPRYIFGHSLGGAIAVHLGSEVGDEAGVIVEGTFTSIADVFRTMKWGWLPLTPFITQRFDAAERVQKIGAPLLVVHGSEDRLISPSLGRALYDKARDPKRFELVEGGSHHNTNSLGQQQYRAALREFFGLDI